MTPTHAHFDIYEVHTILCHIATPEEAATNTITIPDIEPHAVVIAHAKFARAYGELSTAEREEAISSALAPAPAPAHVPQVCPFGDITFGEALHRYSQLCRPLTEITNVAYTAPDTTVTFANITEGAQIDMFIPIVSTPPLSDVQCGISHDSRLYDYRADCICGDGEVFIHTPLGNDDLKKFISSLYDTENASIWERTWVLDVTQYDPLIHDVFFEVHIDKYERTYQGATRVTFTFKLPQYIY